MYLVVIVEIVVVDVVVFEWEEIVRGQLDYLESIAVGSMELVDFVRRSESGSKRKEKIVIFDAEDMDAVPQACQLEVFVEPEIFGRVAGPVNYVVEGAVVVDSIGENYLGAEKRLGTDGVAPGFVECAWVERGIVRCLTKRESAGTVTEQNTVLLVTSNRYAAALELGVEEEVFLDSCLDSYLDMRVRHTDRPFARGRGSLARDVGPARAAADGQSLERSAAMKSGWE